MAQHRMNHPRRRFIRITASTGLTIACGAVFAQAAAAVNEKDPQATALGYVSDAARADKTKYPKYAAGQKCAACALYQGAPTAAMAPCALFAGRQVNGGGWCSAFAPRAG